MSNNKFKITKDLMEAYVNNGLTVHQMAEDVTTKSGVKCSDHVIRVAAKTYGINLRLKRMPNHFIFDDLATTVPATAAVQPTNNAVSYAKQELEEPTVQL